MGPLRDPRDGVDAVLPVPARRHRKVWSRPGRIHVELRAGDDPEVDGLEKVLQHELTGLPGVTWVALNGVSGRAVIAFDPARVTVDELLDAVARAEQVADVADRRFPNEQNEHPGDRGPIRREGLAIAADAMGMGLAVAGRLAHLARLPIEVAAVVPLIQSQPRLRALFEIPFGPAAADTGLALGNAAFQALAQGSLGLVVDAAQRGVALSELVAVRRRWEEAESALCREPTRAAAAAVSPPERPEPPAPTATERYADRAGLASMAAGATALLATRSPRRAAAAVLAGSPKASRTGLEAFAANLGRDLAGRGIVVLDRSVLRRLDAIDSVVLDAPILLAETVEVERLELLDDDVDPAEAMRRLTVLLDAGADQRTRRRGEWSAGPLERLRINDTEAREEVRRRLGDGPVVALASGERLVAAATLVPALRAGACGLVAAAREAGLMVAVGTDDLRLVDRLGADLAVDSGDDLPSSVRMLQDDGCRAALIAEEGDEALVAADLGIGMVSDEGGVPWGADLLCPAMEHAHLVLDAVAVAKEVTRQSAAIAVGGAGTGALLMLGGLPTTATRRALSAVNAAALLSLANGTRAAVELARRPLVIDDVQPPWHAIDADDVVQRLGSDAEQGLPDGEARRRQRDEEREPEPSLIRSILEELANPLTPVLAAGAALSAAVGSPADAGIVGSVVGLNALVGGIQRERVDRAVRALEARTSSQHVTARRNGRSLELDVADLVVGDIVLLESGDAVPADCRLLAAEHLEVDESSVTGESVPVSKQPAATFAPNVAERHCMLYAGTTVATGSATAVVVAVGQRTEAGAALSLPGGPNRPGVEERLRQLSRITLPLAAAGGVVVTAAGLARRLPLAQALAPGVNLAVAAVPEGLPLLATLAQLSSARRLAARGALVRNPRAIEALGRVDVLCIDKTGTLTQGQIRLRKVLDGVSDEDVIELGDRFQEILAAGLRASPAERPEGSLPHLTDQAVVDGGTAAGIDPDHGCPGWLRRAELPFEPARGYHAVVGGNGDAGCDEGEDGDDDGGFLLSVKGAPEVLLPRCDRWRHPDGVRQLEQRDLKGLADTVDRMARQGYRVLAVAEREASSRRDLEDDRVERLTFLGFLALTDPVRPEAASSVSTLRRAGVDIVMVTGDHPSTAEGVAGELGILNGGRVLTGAELDGLADEELAATLPEVSVFSRVTPGQKVRIVQAFQELGRAVAMTGDGANDAPAIRLADVGVALGESSTAAARAAADLVVPDGRVETIIDAVVEGRAMWSSVRDALAILLGGNLGEVAFTVAGSLLTGRPPVSARQLLLVNLLTDVAPGLAIAVRPPADVTPEQLLTDGPEASLGRALERDIVVRAVFTASGAGGAWAAARLTGRPERASTVALAALVGSQLGQTLVMGGRDPVVAVAALGSAALLAGIIQTPGLSQFFGCTPLGPGAFAIATGSSVAATTGSALVTTVLDRRARARLLREHAPEPAGEIEAPLPERVIDVTAR